MTLRQFPALRRYCAVSASLLPIAFPKRQMHQSSARDCAVAPALVSYVAELVVVLDSPAPSRSLARMLVVRAVDKSLPQRLGIGIPAHEEIGVNTQRVPPHSFACL